MAQARALAAWGSTTLTLHDVPVMMIRSPDAQPDLDAASKLDELRRQGHRAVLDTRTPSSINQIEVVQVAGQVQIDWANALIAKLAEVQQDDGSFVNEADRWMEGDPSLVTAYSLIALQEAIR